MIKLNGTELIFKTFPNGETLVDGQQIEDLLRGFSNDFFFKYEHDSDLIKLMFARKHVDERLPCSLTIAYMPYSRMDRVEGSSVFTLKYVSEFINSLGFERVTVIEPHSDVTLNLLNNSSAIYPSIELLERVIADVKFDAETDYVFFPDEGAQKRYENITGFKYLVGNKKRDFDTGKILSLDVVGEVDRKGFKAIIVDDLSSYGGTFMMSAAKLKELGASEIYLLVGHAEFSIYEGNIFKDGSYIDKVFTTDSILNKQVNIKIYNVEEI